MTRFSIISTKRFLAKLSLLEKKNIWRNGAHECFIDLDLFMVYTRLRIDCKSEITKLQGPGCSKHRQLNKLVKRSTR